MRDPILLTSGIELDGRYVCQGKVNAVYSYVLSLVLLWLTVWNRVRPLKRYSRSQNTNLILKNRLSIFQNMQHTVLSGTYQFLQCYWTASCLLWNVRPLHISMDQVKKQGLKRPNTSMSVPPLALYKWAIKHKRNRKPQKHKRDQICIVPF